MCGQEAVLDDLIINYYVNSFSFPDELSYDPGNMKCGSATKPCEETRGISIKKLFTAFLLFVLNCLYTYVIV